MNENNANFTPAAPNFKTLVKMSFQGLTNFPYIEEDFDALTNYGLLSKVVEYLNTVISNNNEQNTLMSNLYNAYVSLQNYVNNYFDNLDVQDEINNKLDEMSGDGTLSAIIGNYVDSDILPLINNQNAIINSINTKVESLESIGPVPVSSTSDMNDTTKIYVNTTDGYWYYYNGSTFVQGGVYQTSQNINQLQGIVDAYYNYNIKGLINWNIGDINSQGELTNSSYFVRTPEMQKFNEDVYIDVSSFTKTTVFLYNEDDSFDKLLLNYQNNYKGVLIKANQKFKLRLDYIEIPEGGRPNISSENPIETALYLGLNMYKYEDFKSIELNKIYDSGYSFDYDNLKYYPKCILGDYGTSTGLNQNPSSYRRITTYNVLKYKEDVIIKSNIPAQAYLWFYDDLAETNPVGQGWKDIYNTEVIVPKEQCFRFVVSKSNTFNEPLYSPYDNDVYKALVIKNHYPEDEPIVTTINPNINYIRSVAHQGYSATGAINYCKLSGYQNAKDHGFNYGELDLRMTSDNVLVCCHDNTFTSGGETITISTSTYNEIKDLDYYGENIATFEEILSLCKKIGLGVYIDHLYTLNNTGWQTMFNLIRKYQMQDNVVYLCNELQSQIDKIMDFYYKSKIAFVSSTTDLTNIINLINTNKTKFNKFSIDINYNNFSVESVNQLVADLDSDVDVEVWTIDNYDSFNSYIPYVSGITSNTYSIIDFQ